VQRENISRIKNIIDIISKYHDNLPQINTKYIIEDFAVEIGLNNSL
jgi:hypothetical protein